MPNLRDIQKRIDSVASTRQITRTMEMVATAKVRRASDRVAAATPYSDSMNEMLGSVAEHASGLDHPLLVARSEMKRVIVIAVVSDRGLAGGFNSNILRKAERYIQAKKAEGAQADVIVCGKKGIAYFNYRKIAPVMAFRDLSADPTIDEARQIAQYVIDEYAKAAADEVVLMYNHARNVADQDVMEETVLPIETSAFERDAEQPAAEDGTIKASYEFEPDASDVLAKLLPAYVETRIYHALVDSAAGEQGARRKAMKAATDNATEMVDTLTRTYNRVRQGAITTELNEIVGGAAALED